MHIQDGFLPVSVLVGGYAVAGAWIAGSARKMEPEDMPRVAVMSAAFFVASLVHIRLAGTSVHLLLHGVVGIVLGIQAPLAIGLGLVLQFFLFGHGGITTLGFNICMMGLPAALVGWLFRVVARKSPRFQPWFAGALAGFAVALSGLIAASALVLAGEAFRNVAGMILFLHLPIMGIEAVIGGLVVGFLGKVKPEMIHGPLDITPLEPGTAEKA